MKPALLLLAMVLAGCGADEPSNRVVYWRLCVGEAENAAARRFLGDCVKANTIRNTQTFSPEDMVDRCKAAALATCPQHLMVGPVGQSPDWGTYVPCSADLDAGLLDLCHKAGWRP